MGSSFENQITRMYHERKYSNSEKVKIIKEFIVIREIKTDRENNNKLSVVDRT